MALPRTSWRRRPLLVLVILILLLVIGYAVRAFDDGASGAGSRPAGPAVSAPHPAASGSLAQPASTAHRGGRLAAKAAIPSCACSLAK